MALFLTQSARAIAIYPVEWKSMTIGYAQDRLQAPEVLKQFQPVHSNPDDRYRSVAEGSLSFVAALFPILSFIALSTTSFSFFIIPVFLFAIPAVIFGAIGLRRRKRGFAILGLSLGLLEIVVGIVALAIL